MSFYQNSSKSKPNFIFHFTSSRPFLPNILRLKGLGFNTEFRQGEEYYAERGDSSEDSSVTDDDLTEDE